MTKKYVFTLYHKAGEFTNHCGAVATLKAMESGDIKEIRHGMEPISRLDLEEMARLEQKELEHERRQGL